MLLLSLLEQLDRRSLLKLQQWLVESELGDAGWDFELHSGGQITATNPDLPGKVAVGPLEYGSCTGRTNGERVADLVSYYTNEGIPTVTAIIHDFKSQAIDPQGGDDYSNSTVIFPNAAAAFRAMLHYQGCAYSPTDLLNHNFHEFVGALMTAKPYA